MIDSEVKISIIIPFFNSQKTLDRCIKSLINQDISEIQLVMVNDGSTDDSLELVNKYAANDNRFTVISQSNKGQGAARNEGIRSSLGEYILFVDSDDYLEPMILGTMYGIAKSNQLDILTGKLNHIDEKGREYCFPPENPGIVEDGRKCLMRTGVCYSLCAHLYRRDFLANNNLYMMEGVRYEDMDYCIRTTWLAKRVMEIDTVFYNYMVHEGSVSNGSSFDIVEDYYKVTKQVIEFVKEKVDSEAYEAYFRDYIGFLCSHMINLCATGNFSIKSFFEDEEREKNILFFLRNAKSRRYHIQYFFLRYKMFEVYKFIYRIYWKRGKKCLPISQDMY